MSQSISSRDIKKNVKLLGLSYRYICKFVFNGQAHHIQAYWRTCWGETHRIGGTIELITVTLRCLCAQINTPHIVVLYSIYGEKPKKKMNILRNHWHFGGALFPVICLITGLVISNTRTRTTQATKILPLLCKRKLTQLIGTCTCFT